MRSGKKIIFLLLPLFTSLLSAAQTTGTERREIYFRILETYRVKDTMIIFLDGARDLGITPGLWIKGYKSAKPNSNQKDLTQLGSGRVVKADSLVMAFIKLFNPTDTLGQGDMISLELRIPALPYRSVFSKLSFYNIEFTDNDSEPLYSMNELINWDSHSREDSLYADLLDDLHETFQTKKDRTRPDSLFAKTIKEGRYKAKSVVEVLGSVSKSELEEFLIYVTDINSTYIGKSYNLGESFAAWLASNSPYGYSSIKKALFPVYKNKTAFEKLIPVYNRDILAGHAAARLGAQAEKMELNDALAQIDFAEALATSVHDTAGNVAVHLSLAKIYQDHKNYNKAIEECDKVIQLSSLLGNRDMEMRALFKKIDCLDRSQKYSTGLALLSEANKKLDQYKTELGDNLYKKHLQTRYQYEGIINYDQGDYDQALQAYAKAIDINKNINSYEAIDLNAYYYELIGLVNNDQGKPNDALESFRKSATIYRHNFDTLYWGFLQNDIALSYYKLTNYRQSIAYCDSAFRKLLGLRAYGDAGYSKSLMGYCYLELGKYDSALLLHKECIELRKKGNNMYDLADSWERLGRIYYSTGLKNEALNAYDSSTLLYEQLKDSAGLAEIYNRKGKVYLNDENYKTATYFFEKARGFNSKITVESLYNLGAAWEPIDTTKARFYYTACKRKSDSTENTTYSFDTRKALAYLAYREKKIRQGNSLYEECVAISKQLNTPFSVAACLALKGERYYNEAEMDSALSYYNKAFEIFDTVSKEEAIWQLNYIAEAEIEMGKFEEAERVLISAITMARNASFNLELGKSLETTSFLYALTGDFDKGMNNSDSAMSIFHHSGNLLRLADTYVDRGTLLKGMGDYNQSIRSFLWADSLYRTEFTEDYRHVALNNIGDVYLNQNDYGNALNYFEQALQRLKKGAVDESYLLYKGNIAECLYDLKKYKQAEAEFLEIIPLAKERKLNRITSGMQLALGELYFDLSQVTKATEQFNYAKDYALLSGEKEKIIDAFTYLGRIYIRSNQPDSAENNFRKAIAVVARYKIPDGWEPYYELGLLFYNQKSFDSSIVYFQQAVDMLDKNTENLYGGAEAKKIFNNDPRKSDLYNKIVFAYYNTGNIKQAWAYANRSNIAGLKELSGSPSFTADKEKNETLKKLISLQQSKKELETTAAKQTGQNQEQTLKRIEIVESDYTNFLQDVVEKYPDLSSYFGRFNADEFYNYKGKLPEDAAVALYLVNDKTLMIFTLTNEALTVDTMTADISKLVTAFISATRQPQRNTGTGALHLRSEPTDEDDSIINIPFQVLSEQLYRILISPVYDKIKNKKKLCVIPSGIFSNMPFQCLGRKQPDSSFRFLIEDYGIFYTNKMKVFDQNNKGGPSKNDLLSFAVFGVPDQALHYNTEEAKEIGKLIGIDSTVYTDNRATESRAKFSLTQKKYIHFATHGVLNYSQQFSQSYLKFLPDKDTSNGNNGQLTIREIQSLPIRDCDLVTLSACETAITKELVKGWNISPANSFLERNVRSVIASLWKVDDEATSILMNEFYTNLNKGMDKVDALRAAQETLSKNPKYAHPFYWGAFVLYGDWR